MQNLLKNPGFEKGRPDNWQTYETGTAHKYRFPELGRKCIGFSVAIERPSREIGKIASWIQDIIISPNKKYKISGYLEAENIIGSGASIYVDWKDKDGKYISSSNIMERKTGTISWTYFEGIITPHPNSVKATIVLELYDSSGKVWFDDISFIEEELLIRYRCTPNYQCVEDPNGPYDSLEACQAVCKAPLDDYVPPGYKKVFEDHFDGTSLDASKWRHSYGSYKIENSNLILGINDNGGMVLGSNPDNTAKWKFKYGYVVFRAKFADTNNRGHCNQLWYVTPGDIPHPRYHEVDMHETATGPKVSQNVQCLPGRWINKDHTGINTINMSVHAHGVNPSIYNRHKYYDIGLDLGKDYHIYSSEWTPDYVTWLVDGVERNRITPSDPSGSVLIPDEYMFLIMALCKRGPNECGCWPATEGGSGPAKMYIDYTRVYQK